MFLKFSMPIPLSPGRRSVGGLNHQAGPSEPIWFKKNPSKRTLLPKRARHICKPLRDPKKSLNNRRQTEAWNETNPWVPFQEWEEMIPRTTDRAPSLQGFNASGRRLQRDNGTVCLRNRRCKPSGRWARCVMPSRARATERRRKRKSSCDSNFDTQVAYLTLMT